MRQTKKLLIPLVCFGLFLTGYYLVTLQYTIYDMAKEYGLNDTLMGLIITIQYIAMILLPIPLGGLSDRFGKKMVYYIQSISLVAGPLLVFLSGNTAVLFIGVLISGAGYGLMSFLSIAVVTDAYPHSAGKFVTISSMSFCVGAVLAPLVSNEIISSGAGWRVLYLIICIAAAVALAALIITKVEKVAIKGENEIPKQKIGQILKNPLIYILSLTIILYLCVESCGSSFIKSFFDNIYPQNIDAGTYAAWALSLFWLMFIPSRTVTSMVKGKKYPMLIGSFLLCAVVLLMISFVKTEEMSLIGFAVLGLACGPIWPTLMSLGSRAFYENSGFVSGINTSSTAFGGAVSAPLIGALAQNVGYDYIFIAVAVFALLGLGVYLITVRKFSKKGLKSLL